MPRYEMCPRLFTMLYMEDSMTVATTTEKKEADAEKVMPRWHAFLIEGDGLTKIGENSDWPVYKDGQKTSPPDHFDKSFDVLVVEAAEDPLGEDGKLKRGVRVTMNPHKSESPFTYTT